MRIKDMYRLKPIDDKAVETLRQQLAAAVDEMHGKIAMAEQVAEALRPIRHHKQVNRAVCGRIMQAFPQLYATLIDRWGYRSLELSWDGPGRTRPQLQFRVEDGMTMAALVDSIQACQWERGEAVRREAQLKCLPYLIDAEQYLREQIENYGRKRKLVAAMVLGTPDGYYHEAVRDLLHALCAPD